MTITKKDCVAVLRNSGLSELDAVQTVEAMMTRKKRLAADGNAVRAEAELAAAVTADHDAARLEIALKRKQTALTIMRRMAVDDFLTQTKAAGHSFIDGIKALLVGHGDRFFGARSSIDARRSSIAAEWGGRLANEFEAIGEKFGGDGDTVFFLLVKDKEFQLDFAREVISPGSTQNKKAAAVADVYTRMSDEMRRRHNDAGANIGRLEGRLPQSHDVMKLLDKKNGGQEGWINTVMQHLDAERSFPGKNADEVRDILRDVYHTIISGRDLNLSGAEKEFVGPRNIASGLGKHRVLHFRDAESFMAYHEKYGRGTLVEAINGEIIHGARRLSLMEVLGPNPESMLRSLVDAEKDGIRAAMKAGTLDAASAEKQLRRLNSAYNTARPEAAGKAANWMKALTGETSSPADVGLAKYGAIARAWMSVSKLGGAALSALADPFTKAASLRVNGVGFLERYNSALFDYFQNYKGREREIARELGFLIKDVWGEALNRFDPQDATPGRVSKAMNHFFKWSGIDYITESGKAGYAMMLSRHVAAARHAPFEKLIPEIRAMLEYHGVDAKTWDIWRQMTEGVKDKRYFNPALARNLTDAQIAHLLPEHLQTPDAPGRARGLDRIRRNLETDARAFFADDTKFAVIEPDAATTAVMTQGSRPGTWSGEVLRAAMQFKSFPIAYWQRQIGGSRWKRGGAEGFDYPGVIEFAVSAFAFGYLAMTLKDISKNRTPRKVWDEKGFHAETVFAAAMQSGGLGIFGDFFLGKVNRFGSDFAETAVGPLGGVVSDLVKTGSLALHGEPGQARDSAIRMTLNNTPYINLFYTRAAMDWLFLDRIKEAMSPGYKRRMLRNMEKEFGQRPLF